MPSDVDTWYARPVFFVTDCEEALRFYARLGFVEDWRHEEEGPLLASGARVVLEPRNEPWGKTAGYLDPDGNIVSIAES